MRWILLALPLLLAGCVYRGEVSHYGASYQGEQMGCPGSGLYDSANPTIAAVGYDLASNRFESPYRCGDVVGIKGPAGIQVVVVQDTCPGCGWHRIDLSEAAHQNVCGPDAGVCDVVHLLIERK